eukprot:TRINITY_DN4252_c0_g5_i1.p2 TRINITY_DN4252_c0_g5~~TRINITY_DN4252_c0_g5_i1.p2  ORF type:complete len:342 (-),score=-3.00 TRINITY_DN4252_c0_g5_i1:132-1157(-)
MGGCCSRGDKVEDNDEAPTSEGVKGRKGAPVSPPACDAHYPPRKRARGGEVVAVYSPKEVHRATDGFARLVGRGGFGRVFHGCLAEGEGEVYNVAVKVIEGEHIANNISSFMAEVQAMVRIRHPNILHLEGVVINATPMLLYEYVAGGDAAAFLAQAALGKVQFPWAARLRVALGCAEALAAMHAHDYVHRDFKASNVLLREDLTPVVADFGLARAVEDWQTHVQTRVMGSIGYIDPFYFQTGNLGFKSDTYAFGIFLLELASGCSVRDERFASLRRAVYARQLPDPRSVMDPSLLGQWQPEHALIVFTLVKYAIFYDWKNRPGMDVMRNKLRALCANVRA